MYLCIEFVTVGVLYSISPIRILFYNPSHPPPQDADLGLVLVRSMMEGATLIVTEVECQTLVTNTRLMDALLIRKVISRATTPQKVMVSCATFLMA